MEGGEIVFLPTPLSQFIFAPQFQSFNSTVALHGHVAQHDMWILPLVGYTGVLLGFGFLTLAIGIYTN